MVSKVAEPFIILAGVCGWFLVVHWITIPWIEAAGSGPILRVTEFPRDDNYPWALVATLVLAIIGLAAIRGLFIIAAMLSNLYYNLFGKAPPPPPPPKSDQKA